MWSGKIRAWPYSTEYNNVFCQIWLKDNDDELYIYNGYMTKTEIATFNALIGDFSAIEVVNMKNEISRKIEKDKLSTWCIKKQIDIFSKATLFLQIINMKRERNKNDK